MFTHVIYYLTLSWVRTLFQGKPKPGYLNESYYLHKRFLTFNISLM
jgi:hypothetical protein